VKGNILSSDIALFFLRCVSVDLRGVEHIFDENSVSGCRIVDEDVSDRVDELAVLDDGRAAHECVQIGTTFLSENNE
jgi:hypothetical protein